MNNLKYIILFFFISLITINTQAQCNGTQSFTLSPQPTNGEYVAGTIVNVCYTMNGWTQFNSNWVDGFLITLGSGWTNLTPGLSPTNCNGGGGQWIWIPTSTTFGSNTIGPGWYFDLQSDGNPTNDYGDNGTTCSWSFCFTIKAAQTCTPQSLSIQVTAGADGTWGSWTQTGCPTTPIGIFNGTSQPTPLTPPAVAYQTTYCVGDNASPLVATALPGNTLLWYTTLTGGVGQSSITPQTNTDGITTYYVSQLFPCGESPRVSTTVIVYPKPIIENRVDTICSGTAFNLTPSNAPPTTIVPPGTLYTWVVTPNPNISGYSDETIGQSFISQTLVNNSTTPQNITYNITPIGPNCVGNTFSLEVVVKPTPVVTTPNNITICNGLYTPQIVLNNPPSVGNISWTNNNTSIGLPQSGDNIIPSFLTINSTQSSITSTIVLTPSYDNCVGIPDSFDITVTPRFLLGNDLDIDSCYNSGVNLNILYNTDNLTTSWTLNNNPIINTEHILISGDYQLIATNSANCSDTAIVRVNILPKVIANAGRDTIAVLGQPHQLMGSGGVSYLWTPSSPIISLSTIYNPIVVLNQDQSFYLETKDIGGCKGFDTVFVKVYKGPEYYLPNSFTPNNDGVNDIFRPIPVGIVSTEYFKIYNRNGLLLFQTNIWLKGWDGKYNGMSQPIGTYVWLIKGVDKRGNVIEKKGTVVLIR